MPRPSERPTARRGETPVLDAAAFDDFAALFHRDELRGVIEEWHAEFYGRGFASRVLCQALRATPSG